MKHARVPNETLGQWSMAAAHTAETSQLYPTLSLLLTSEQRVRSYNGHRGRPASQITIAVGFCRSGVVGMMNLVGMSATRRVVGEHYG